MNLSALLFDVARRVPRQLAVSDNRQSLSYSELADRITRLAGGLRAYGLAPGDRVLLVLENCSEFFELLFACWTAGLCAVPANARLHPREVEYIAENSSARLLVATPTLAEALAPLEASVASLERVISTRSGAYDALLASGEPLCPEPATSTPTDRAWLFYTSGRQPKAAPTTRPYRERFIACCLPTRPSVSANMKVGKGAGVTNARSEYDGAELYER
jgi:acyl-CoA synthetase (AMP-forming)/AMP-acid ligase II